jgi:hypothetical protein
LTKQIAKYYIIKNNYISKILMTKLIFCWATAVFLPQLIDPERWQLSTMNRFMKIFNTEAIIEHARNDR